MPRIRVKRGLKANLPTSAPLGELLVSTDTREMHIGTGSAVQALQTHASNVTGAGQPNTLATLDSAGKVPASQLPDGASFTPLAHRFAPADNDAARQAWLVQLRQDMIAAGIMNPPATYTVSGVVSGSVQAGVQVTLTRPSYSPQTVTTNSLGEYTFTGVEEGGVYTITPSLTGHYFTPSTRTINDLQSNATAQNFTAALATSTLAMSSTALFVPRNGVSPRLRRLDLATRTFSDPTDFSAITGNVYPVSFINGRHFVPIPLSSQIRVYDDSGTLVATITGLVNPLRVLSASGKIGYVRGSGAAFQFINYNFSNDTWTLGTSITNPLGGAIVDSTSSATKFWLVSNSTPSNVLEIDAATETGANRALGSSFPGGITTIEYADNGVLFIGANTNNIFRLYNASTLALITATSASGVSSHRMAFSQGHFWMSTNSNEYVRVNASTGAVTTIATGVAPGGCVANDSFVFFGDQASSLRVYNATTGALDGSPLSISSAWFPRN